MRLTDVLPPPNLSALAEPEPDALPPEEPAPRRQGQDRSHLGMTAPRSERAVGPEMSSARPGGFNSAAGAAALEQATARLTRGLTHPVVTDGDAAAVLDILGPLNREALLYALSGLEARGLLSRFLEEQSSVTREGFVGLLRERQVLVEGAPNRPPVGPLGPPTLPATLAVAPTHLPPLEALAHEVNAQRARTYRLEREAYLERYVAAVENASNHRELELLGQPVRKDAFERPGWSEAAIARTRALNALSRERTDQDHLRAFQAYTHRRLVLAGERPPMTLRATFSASATKGARQVGINGTWGAEGLRLQPEAGVSGRGAGLKVQVPLDGGAPVVSAGMRVGPAGASVGSDGTLKLEWGPVRVETTPESGQVGFGLGTNVALTRVLPYEVSAGVSLQLADPRRAPAIAWGRGAPDAPRALSEGQRWDALPPEQREALQSAGVRATFWDAVVQAAPRAP